MRVSDLSLEERVGQVFMVGFGGTTADGAVHAIRDLKVGGIIYFARNAGTVAETAALSASLQRVAMKDTPSGLPLLISADQEGGLVSRLTRGLPAMPGPMSLGATRDVGLAEEVSKAIGVQLRSAGINMNLAPVLDVNDNPRNPVIGVRSYGSKVSSVSSFGRAAVRGFISSGICPVGKHFPGHGNTSVDSHLDLPVLKQSMARLTRVELRPFREAIAQALPAIMTAHIVFKAIDPDSPATMSAPVLQGLLRDKMKFAGLILTDCMEMTAVARSPGTVEAPVRAFKAGADMVLISHTPELQEQAYNALLQAVRSGVISEDRLNASVERILVLKQSMSLPNPLDPSFADTLIMRTISQSAHRRSITVLRAEEGLLPLRRSRSIGTVVAATTEPATPQGVVGSGAGTTASKALAEALRGFGHSVREMTSEEFLFENHGITEATPEQVRESSSSAVVIVTQNAWKDPAQAALANRLLQVTPRAIIVAVRDPFDANAVPSARTFICSYSPKPEAMEAVAAVLSGVAKATGVLPVALS